MKLKYKIAIAVVSVLLIGAGSVVIAKGWLNKEKPVIVELPDANTEWQKLVQHYQQLQQTTGLNLQGTIKLYEGKSPDLVKEQSNTIIRNKGNQFFYSVSDVRYYCDGTMLLQVDHINKMAVLSKAVQGNYGPQVFPHIDPSLSPDQKKFGIAGQVEGDDSERRLTMQSELNPEIKKYTIVYDPANYNMKSVEIEWWKSHLNDNKSDNFWITKIQYTHLPAVELDMEEQIRKIISVEKGQITLIGAEKDYSLEVINN
jgi:hypothetical protein